MRLTERSWLQVDPEIDQPPDVPATGEPRVDEALGRLGEVSDLPVSEHPGVFEHVHSQLVDVLGELRPAAAEDRKADADQTVADPQQ